MPTDEDSLVKAMRLRAKRDIDYSQGTSSLKSFMSFPTSSVTSNLEALGVGLHVEINESLIFCCYIAMTLMGYI